MLTANILPQTNFIINNFMKKIYSFKKGMFLVALTLISAFASAQVPLVLYTGLSSTTPSPSNSRFTLNSVGAFKQFRFQSNQTASASSVGWAFHIGSTGSPDYNSNWRPYTGSNTLSVNTYIPTSFANGAKYNTGGGGSDGLLPAITSGNYYTFNVSNNAAVDNTMQLLETSFNPVTINASSQFPKATLVNANAAVTVTITTSSAPSSGENVFLRYTTNSYTTSTIVQFTFVGTTGTAIIPALAATTAVSYYTYSSNKSLASINSDVTTYGQTAHDMSTLNIGTGNSYTVVAGTNPVLVQSSGLPANDAYYTTLGTAFTAINAGTHTGTITVGILGNTAEAVTGATLNASGSGSASYTTIAISPSGGAARTVSAAVTAGSPLIVFNGADNVTIDGLNTNSNSLKISNTTASATAGTSTIKFIGDATSNTIQNCTITGSSIAPPATAGTGVIWFSTGTTTGNTGNIITNNTITAEGSSLPQFLIYSFGTSAAIPNTVTVSNNNFADWAITSASNNAAVYVDGTGNTAWSITGNRIYQTASRLGGSSTSYGINILTGNGNTVNNNIIGYANSSGTGTLTVTSSGATRFVGINLTVLTTTATEVQGNTITAINIATTSGAPTTTGIFSGIYVASTGKVNIGQTTANTIGASSGTGAITLTSTISLGLINGIGSTSTSTVNIQNNIIGAINTGGTLGIGYTFNGINTSGAAGNYTISSNTIGSTSTANSIAVGTSGTTTTGVCTFTGISNAATGTNSITGNTIQNCSSYGTGASVFNGILNSGGLAASTLAITTNNIISGTLSGTGQFTGISNSAIVATLNMNTNVIRSHSLTSTASAFVGVANSAAVTTAIAMNSNQIGNASGNAFTYSVSNTSAITNGIQNTAGASTCTLNINGNTFLGFTLVTASSVAAIVNTSGFVGGAISLSNNLIGSSAGGFLSFSAATSSAVAGISNAGGSATSALTITGNDFRGITHTTQGSSAHTYISNSFATLSQNISTNTFTNLNVNTTGNVIFITNDIQLPLGGSQTINSNSIVTAFNKGGAGGTVQIYLASTTPSSPSGTTHTANLNNFSNITVTGATTLIGWSNLEGAPGPTKAITNNTFSNWTGGSSSITVITTQWSGGTSSITGNTITNITGTGAITGISRQGSGGTAAESISNNTITGLVSSGTGGSVIGITGGATGITTHTISGNTINTLSSTGASSTVAGIQVTAGTTVNINGNTINTLSSSGATSPVVTPISVSSGTTVNVFKNKIYDVSVSGAISTTSPAITGILLSGGTTVTTYNNIVGDLRAPAANLTDAIRGISITSATATTTFNVYYNSVYLSATSSGTNFGTTGIFHTTSATATTAALNLRNNVIVNNSTSNGTGLSVAYRRSSTTLTNYASTSNNNDLYAPVIFNDGTNSDLTMSAYKTRVSTRDAASFSENPTFVSTTGSNSNFLNINTSSATQIESGGVNISTFTDDYFGTIRFGNTSYVPCSAPLGTAPDIGAWEFCGTPAPAMAYSSSNAVQQTGSACAGTNDVKVLRMDVVTTGALTPLTLTSLTINANGTSTFADITSYRIFYTGTSSTFSTSNPITNAASGLTASNVVVNSFLTTVTLAQGTNYFWLAYTMSGSAAGPNVDGEFANVALSTGGGAPTTTAPAGNLTVNPKPTVTVSPTTGSICNPGGTGVVLTAGGATTYSWSPSTGLSATTGSPVTATPTSNTTYIVTGTDGNGCTNTANTTISIGAAVTMSSVSASALTVCSGSNSTLTATATQAMPPLPATYTFAGSTGVYSTITGTTLGAAAIGDDVGIGNLPIGFTFNYNSTAFTVFGARSNGLIELGQTAATLSGFSSNALASNANCIAPLWDDNNTTGGSIIYATTGSVGSRILTVQYTGMHVGGTGSSSNPTINLQILLYEATGVIQYIYGSTSAALSSTTASIGISGASGNYISVTPTSASSPFATTSTSSENTGISAATFFPTGTIYTFTPGYYPSTLSYLWSPGTFLSSTSTNPTTATAVTATTPYSVTVSNTAGCSASGSVTVTVSSGAAIGTQPVSATKCTGQTATFTVAATGPGLTYQWRKNTVNINTGTNASAGTATLSLSSVTSADNGTYDVVVTSTCGSPVTSDGTSTLTVNPVPTSVPSSNTPVCTGNTLNLTGGTDIGTTFSWTGPNGFTSTSQSPSITNVASAAAGTYTFTATASGCSSSANTITVAINASPTGATATASPTTLCVGNSISLTSGYTTSSIAGSGMDSYIATRSTGTSYTSIIPATTITSWRNGFSTDDNLSDNQPIGFSFNYNGNTYTNFRVSTNGFITFNTTSTAIGNGLSSPYSYTNDWTVTSGGSIVAPNWDDLQTAANLTTQADLDNSINYTTTGSAGSRVLTVEWKNMQDFSTTSTASYNMQVKLFEADNHIEFVYGTMTQSAASVSYSLGLSGSTVSATPTAPQLLSQTTQNTATFGFTNSIALTPIPATNTKISFNLPQPVYSWTGPNGFTSSAANPTVSSATTAASGVYNLIVSNSITSCASAQAQTLTVTVNAPPAISSISADQTACSTPGTASYTVAATGDGLTYSWRLNGVALVNGAQGNGSTVAGQGTATLSLSTLTSSNTVAAGAGYDVVVSGVSPCAAATSTRRALTVSTAPSISAISADQTACSTPGTASYTVTAAGSGLSYSWRLNGVALVNGVQGDGSTVAGQGTVTLSLSTLTSSNTVASGAGYDCVVSGTSPCAAATSTRRALTVNTIASITTPPASATVCSGGATDLTVVTAGTSVTYQWQVSTNNGGTWNNATGGVYSNDQTATLHISDATGLNGYQYRVLVNSPAPCSNALTSATATLSVGNVWTGTTDNDGNNAANWTCGSPVGTDIIIPSSVSPQPVLSGSLTVNNIKFIGAGTLSIGSNVFTISGAVSGGGSFTGSTSSELVIAGAAGTVNFTSGSNNNYLKKLTVNASSSMTIGANGLNITAGAAPGAVIVNGTLATADLLTLKSDIDGTARVGTSTGTISGNVTVERYMPSRRAWALVTAPVRNAGYIWDNWQNGGNVVAGTGVNIWGPTGSNPVNSTNGLNQGPAYSMKAYNPAGNNWANTVTNTKTTLLSTNIGGSTADNKSFLLFATNHYDGLGTNITPPNSEATTLSAKGSLQQGDQSFTVGTSAYSIIGNPYASPVNFATFMTHNGSGSTVIQDRFWLYDATIPTYGGYKLVYNTGTGYNIVPAPFTGSGSSAGDYQHLQSGQAIFVEPATPGTGGTITFSETDKSTPGGSPDIYIVNTAQPQQLAVNVYKTSTLLDGLLMMYDNRFSTAIVPAEDVKKVYNDGVNLGIARNNTAYTVEARPEITSKDTSFLWLWNTVANQTYHFQFKADQFNPAITAFLEDAFTGGRTPVSVMGDVTDVSFTTTSDPASTNYARFRIVYAAAGPLPISFTDVNAYQQGANVKVDWKVSNELNADHYEVEYSTNGTSFSKLGDVRATGNTNGTAAYSFLHLTPVAGVNYYRIKEVDISGNTKYSVIVKVTIGTKGNPGIVIYPNPVRASQANLELRDLPAGNYTVTIINDAGLVVSQQTITHGGGTASRQLVLPSLVTSGVYRVQVMGSNNSRYVTSLSITGQ
jgi:hypothetical protein